MEYFLLPALLIAGLIFLYLLFKSDKFLLIATIYVFILDPSGGLFILPLKHLLFLVLILKLLHNFLSKGFKDKWSLPIIFISIIIPFTWTVVSLFRGNNMSYVIGDANGYIFLLSAISMASLVYFNKELKETLLKHFLIASVIVSIATILIAVSNSLFSNIYVVSNWIQERSMGFSGIIEGGSPRIFLKSHLYIMVAFLFTFSLIMGENRKNLKNYITLIMFAITLYLSQTRGLWVGTAVGSLIILATTFSFNFKMTYKKFISLYFLFSVTVITLLISIFTKKDFWISIIEKVKSIFEFSKDISNQARLEQSNYLLNEYFEYPLIGRGFGASLSSGYIRSEEAPYSFELSYFELLYKLGTFGIAMFIFSLILLAILMIKIKDKTIRNMAISSYAALLIVSSTNPFIVSSLGMFLLAVLYVISRENYKTQET